MKRFYSSCTAGLVKPINQKPIGYLVLPRFVGYQTGLEIQQHLVKRRHNINNQKTEQEIDDVICFLEHAPTFTAGRRLNGKSDQQEAQRLRSLGADYFETMRGGQITFHGPGQLIAYPILDIRDYQVNESIIIEKYIPKN
jgi:lipoyl(octanoyl) transferase